MPAVKTATPPKAPIVDLKRASTRLAALGHETRLAIYRTLVRAMPEGCPVGEIQTRLEIPNSTLSFHLKKLIDVGLVIQERRATTLICRADGEAMDQTIGFLGRECCADNC
jgi:ArsR family transcriptional regulator